MTGESSGGGGPKYPEVRVRLSGQDGNVMGIIGRVSLALKRAGYRDAANRWANEAMDCGSYDQVLQLAMRTVEVS